MSAHGHQSNRARKVDVVRAWLQRELGDDANVYHQNAAEPLPAASDAERFSISVPVADAVGLVWLRNKRGPVRTPAMVLIVIAVLPDGVLQSQGRIARRDFIVHFRESA